MLIIRREASEAAAAVLDRHASHGRSVSCTSMSTDRAWRHRCSKAAVPTGAVASSSQGALPWNSRPSSSNVQRTGTSTSRPYPPVVPCLTATTRGRVPSLSSLRLPAYRQETRRCRYTTLRRAKPCSRPRPPTSTSDTTTESGVPPSTLAGFDSGTVPGGRWFPTRPTASRGHVPCTSHASARPRSIRLRFPPPSAPNRRASAGQLTDRRGRPAELASGPPERSTTTTPATSGRPTNRGA